MLYERTAISKKSEQTIKNEIAELRDDGEILLMKEDCANHPHKLKITQKLDF